MTLEMGKVLPESMGEVKYGSEFFRWFAEEAVRIHGRYTPSPAGTGRIIVTKQPVGPCYAITPWNFPLAMGTRKIGPAVAAGCTMIVKPAQETPLTMLLLAKLMDEAGLPKGVLSVLPTKNPGDVTTALIDDGRLRKLTFTGSTGVGKALAKQASDALLRQSMELGGNAPFVVFDDADVDAAVDGAMLAKMRNGGEACTAANRFHVANSVREEFTEKLVKRMSEFTLGKGIDESSTLGPLINAKQVATVADLVSDAVSRGATVAVGGVAPGGPGNFYPATVLADVPADARILKEEVFGPVAPITGFDTEEEGVAAANDTEYGLAAYIYTRRPRPRAAGGRGHRVRHGRRQPRGDLRSGRAVRRRQGVRLRQGGRHRGHRGVPRDEVHSADQVARSPRELSRRKSSPALGVSGTFASARAGKISPVSGHRWVAPPERAVDRGAPRASPRPRRGMAVGGIPALDGIRALAVALVLADHGGIPGVRRVHRRRRVLRAQRIPDHLAAARRTRPHRRHRPARASGSAAPDGCCPR